MFCVQSLVLVSKNVSNKITLTFLFDLPIVVLLRFNGIMKKRGGTTLSQRNGEEAAKRAKLQHSPVNAEGDIARRGILKKSTLGEGSQKQQRTIKRQGDGSKIAIRNKVVVDLKDKKVKDTPKPETNHDGKGKARATTNNSTSKVSEFNASPLATATATATATASAFEVIVGSYERILYGLYCTVSGSGRSTSVTMQPVFQFPGHLSCVKTVHASPGGRWLASGAADEVIKIWDLKRKKEIGGLLGHDGKVS